MSTGGSPTQAEELDRIEVDSRICLGQARVKGTRITVEFVLNLIASGYDVKDVLEAYPELEDADIRQCARYGAWGASDQTWDI